MSKKLRRVTRTKRRPRPAVPVPRNSVSRREYAALALRLGTVELQMQRNRTVIDSQGQRIAQIQEQINSLQARPVTQGLGKEHPAVPSVTTPTVES